MIDIIISLLTLVATFYAIMYMINNHPKTLYIGYGLLVLGVLYLLFFTEFGKVYMSFLTPIAKSF